MAVEVSKVDVWAGEIVDRPGGLAARLEALAQAGANLEFVIARRQHGKKGKGVVFVAPVKGARQTKAAQDAGLAKASPKLHSLRVQAADEPGLCARISRALADAGINMRGLSAAALEGQSVIYFAFDSDRDAKTAARVVKKLLR